MNDKRWMIFCDFDGTIARQDVVDCLLERFADPEWLAIEKEWAAGRISARDCLDRQMACTRFNEADLVALLREIEIDPGFSELARWARKSGVPLNVISDGFDWIIRRLFDQNGVNIDELGIHIFASHLEFGAQGIAWNFPHSHECVHGCGTCKPEVMRRVKTAGAASIVIGDGRSDRLAAHAADMVFAKDWLQAYCAQERIPHQEFSELSNVLAHLSGMKTVVAEGIVS